MNTATAGFAQGLCIVEATGYKNIAQLLKFQFGIQITQNTKHKTSKPTPETFPCAYSVLTTQTALPGDSGGNQVR
jgi:hypothetical protein